MPEVLVRLKKGPFKEIIESVVAGIRLAVLMDGPTVINGWSSLEDHRANHDPRCFRLSFGLLAGTTGKLRIFGPGRYWNPLLGASKFLNRRAVQTLCGCVFALLY